MTPSCSSDLSNILQRLLDLSECKSQLWDLEDLWKIHLRIECACNPDHCAQLVSKTVGKCVGAFSAHVSLQ